jgi:hypothetical protein
MTHRLEPIQRLPDSSPSRRGNLRKIEHFFQKRPLDFAGPQTGTIIRKDAAKFHPIRRAVPSRIRHAQKKKGCRVN